MKGMRGLCVTVKAELEEMSPKVCALFIENSVVSSLTNTVYFL